MINKRIFFSFLVVMALVAVGCSDYSKALKSPNPQVKFDMALKLYNDQAYIKSMPLWEELIGLTRGTKMSEDVYYYYAKSQFGAHDFYLSNYYFKNFAKTFSTSARAEECQFLAAICSYNLSPDASLDQTDTKTAINELQLFLDLFPKSALRDSANHMIGTLNAKIESKEFEVAKLYYTTEKYKGAVNALKEFQTTYPSSIYREEALYLIVKSYYLYAEGSVPEKKLERYRLATESYITFATAFPKSDYLKDAEIYYEKSRRQIEKLTASN
ncbi:MAG: outer membrane protein assembly factor BamD [Flavobacteriales bacterium]|jgi:outer membrane protein assembly factor BamD